MTQKTIATLRGDLVRISGPDRIDLLHRLSSQDLHPLEHPGRVLSTLFTTNQGKLIDWVWLLSTPDALIARTSPGRGARVMAWIDQFTIMEDVTATSLPWQVVIEHGGEPSSAPKSTWVSAEAQGGGWWFPALCAYGGRREGWLPGDEATAWMAQSRSQGVAEATPAEVEHWRILAGVPSPEAEFAEEVNPLELRLRDVAISFAKGCYVGQEVISRLDSYDKVARLLIGVNTESPAAVPSGAKLLREGKTLGRITSWTPEASGRWGLAVVKRAAAEAGEAVVDLGGGSTVPVQLEERPFGRQTANSA